MEDATTPVALAWLVRHWRNDIASMTLRQLALTTGVAASAVANWEAGRRRPNLDMLSRIDIAFDAGGAFAALAAAVGTPGGLDPDSDWWHNYPGAGPIWAWIRTVPGLSTRVDLRWGPLGITIDQAFHPRGVVVSVPVSVSNPPAHIHLDPPGWVDFGPGTIPRQLAIAHIHALSVTGLLEPSDHALAAMAARLQPLLDRDGRWVEKLVGLAGRRSDLVAAAFRYLLPAAPITDLGGLPPPTTSAPAAVCIERWSGERLRQLREARGMSQADAANRVTKLDPSASTTDDQIAKLEAGGEPRVPHLRTRLDVVYQADGRTVCATIPPVPGTAAHTFTMTPPPWWSGPIWLLPHAPPEAPPEDVILRWPPWQHHIRLHPHTPLTTRKAPDNQQPLTIELPPQWTLHCGLGNHPHAVDVNNGWSPIDRHHADTIFNRYVRTYLDLFNSTPTQLLELLRTERAKRDADT